MLVIIFSYNREEKLKALLKEFINHRVIVIDDGSEWTKPKPYEPFGQVNEDPFIFSTLIRTHHEGKKGFWKKWVMARQIALGSEHLVTSRP